jgi:hypothetical protein
MNCISRIAVILLFLIPALSFSQDSEKKHRMYFEWGYNRDWYSKSTITFNGPNNAGLPYQFTAYDLKAKDDFREDDLVTEMFVPQYGYRIGYIFNPKKGFGIEFNYDHAKYVVTNGQTAHVAGMIDDQFFDTDTIVDSPFLHFEHTNGANFCMINFVWERYIHTSKSGKFHLVHTIKGGLGVVVPKTYIQINGHDLDNDFHIAGYIGGVETGLKAFYKEHFFLNLAAKYSYANYYNALGLDNGKVSHHFLVFEALLSIGYQFRI